MAVAADSVIDPLPSHHFGPGDRLRLSVPSGGRSALAAPAEARQIRESVATYPSGGRDVTLECFVPAKAGKHPAVFLLHGTGGLEGGTGVAFRRSARAFAKKGYVALILHLFDATGHEAGGPPRGANPRRWPPPSATRSSWRRPRDVVDPTRLAVVGFSMGSNIATTRAARGPRIKAVACWSGSYPPRPPDRKPPPLPILHGSEDDGTPLDLVRRHEGGLEDQGMPHEVHIDRGAGHDFDARQFEDATARAIAFFDKRVKPAEKPR